jgi:DNA modification methylase
VGLGSTAVACARLGVGFIGSDLDESYLKVAVERAKVARFPSRMRKAELRESGKPQVASAKSR